MGKNYQKDLLRGIEKILKPLGLSKADPDEIIEISDILQKEIGLPPKMKRKDYWAYQDKQIKESTKELRKYLQELKRLEDYTRKHPSKITFSYA